MNLNPSYKAITESYTQYLQTLGFSASVYYNYPRSVSDFLIFAQERAICQINHITTKTVWDYYTYLEHSKGKRTKQPLSNAHLNRTFGAIDKFLEFLHHIGVNDAPTPLRYQLEHIRKKPLRPLTQEEIKSLYDAVPHTFSLLTLAQREPRQMAAKLALVLCYGCGLRRSEAVNLKISDIDFDKRVIHVKQGKNYKDRFVPMSKQIYNDIQTFVYQYRRCFNRRAGYLYPFGSGALAEALDMFVEHSNNESVKEKKPSLHTLRHSIATHLLKNGMDIEHIARFLGHGTLESTQIYTHIINEHGNEF